MKNTKNNNYRTYNQFGELIKEIALWPTRETAWEVTRDGQNGFGFSS